jgi:SP family facilitated glucose transporter-like MFS transporter 8
MQTLVDKTAAQRVSFVKAFRTTAAKKGLMVAFGLMIFQQLSGINAVIFYTTSIFEVSIT